MVAREKNTIHERHPCHAGRLFRWQRRRRSTEDVPREERAQALYARRTKISQEKNLKGLTEGTVTDNTAPHITKADLVDNITENIVVLDICRIPWSWTYSMIQGNTTAGRGNDPGQHHSRKGKT